MFFMNKSQNKHDKGKLWLPINLYMQREVRALFLFLLHIDIENGYLLQSMLQNLEIEKR